jgi:hypothetical protein
MIGSIAAAAAAAALAALVGPGLEIALVCYLRLHWHMSLRNPLS